MTGLGKDAVVGEALVLLKGFFAEKHRAAGSALEGALWVRSALPLKFRLISAGKWPWFAKQARSAEGAEAQRMMP